MTDKIAPRYRVVAIDETDNWDPAITAITGRIAGVYIINFAEVTHICSLRGSYWAEFVCNITEHYIREPDGYRGSEPIWDMDFAAEYPEDHARSVALAAAWGGPFYGLTYENGGESGMYVDEGFPEPDGDLIDVEGAGWDENPADMEPEDAERYRRERDQAAYEAASEYMANGEDWSDIAPWNR